ncbi:MAG: PLDc N-terminal domain-containing protein, partial [Lachnospiraceae bacterium]|nr:PLDc N-terminal domain-containing protein [Lachnospiraceae bacterium]
MFETAGEGFISTYRWMMDHLFVINIIFSLVIIFFQRRNPTTVWAWLLLLYFIPILGFIVYLILGQNFRKERIFK